MSKPSTRYRPAAKPPTRKTSNTRRAREAARRARKQWLRMFGYGTVGVVLVAIVTIIAVAATSTHGSSGTIKVGARAPDGSFTTVGGDVRTVSSLRGQPTLVWFVATWCSSCQAGTEAMASQITNFAAHKVRVVELEMADDLGQPGPSIGDFGSQFAGSAYTNSDWTWGVASSALTTTYDPHGNFDIYYLIDSSGHITYVNGSPGATMDQLLAEVTHLGTHD